MKRAFTITELLVVMAVIAILTALLVGGASVAGNRGKISRTRALIAELDLSVRQYETDHGDYPAGEGGPESAVALHEALTSSMWGGAKDFARSQLGDLGGGRMGLVDAWQRPILYYHNRSYQGGPRAGSFRIISGGPDGEEGTDDDITNF